MYSMTTYLDFLPQARRLVKKAGAGHGLKGADRAEFVEAEAYSLASTLAEVANQRLEEYDA